MAGATFAAGFTSGFTSPESDMILVYALFSDRTQVEI